MAGTYPSAYTTPGTGQHAMSAVTPTTPREGRGLMSPLEQPNINSPRLAGPTATATPGALALVASYLPPGIVCPGLDVPPLPAGTDTKFSPLRAALEQNKQAAAERAIRLAMAQQVSGDGWDAGWA